MDEFYKIKKRNYIKGSFLLILINVVVFLLFFIVSIFYSEIINYLFLFPNKIVQGKSLWTLLTSVFLHANFAHLFFNMISLFFLGTLVEQIIGKKRFLKFYLISGLIASLFFSLLSGFFGYGIGEKIFGNPSIAGVGASGAIFGLVGILTVLIPQKKVYLVIGPLIAIILQSLIGSFISSDSIVNIVSLILEFYILISIFTMLSFNSKIQKLSLPVEMPFWILPFISIIPLILIGFFIDLPIGNIAHLGGFIVGLIYGFYLKSHFKNKVNYIKRLF